VVVVTLDTTRADRLGAWGYAGAQTDTIDRLAATGTRFARAYSPLPLTIPAHATMFTGLYPFHHNIRSNGDNVLADSFVTLAERFQDEGYATAASVGAFVTTRQWGFAQGFEAYFDSLPEEQGGKENYWHTERDGATVVDDALAWLAEAGTDRPVFLWLHLYDAHFPYVARPQYPALAGKPYDAELAYVDDQLGRVVEAMQGRKALFALIGDHGESLGAHGESQHGLFAFEATAHVPWVLSGANVPAGRVVEEPVATADLTPTLLRFAGMLVPTGLDGVAQPAAGVPYVESYQLAERFRLAPHRAVVSGPLKLIALPRPELYDVVADPAETHDLAAERPQDVARLAGLLDALGATPPGAASEALDPATVEQLAALGYVSGGAGVGEDPLALPDPKDFPGLVESAERLNHAGAGGPGAAAQEVDRLLAVKPDAFELRMRKSSMLRREGAFAEARAFAQGTAEMFPGRARVWVTLAGMARSGRDLEGVIEYADRALAADPRTEAAWEMKLDALFRARRDEEGLATAAAAEQALPGSPGVAAVMGKYWLAKGDAAQAEVLLRRAVAGANPRRGARLDLAHLALAAGAPGDAELLLEAELKAWPGDRNAHRSLSRVFAEQSRWLDQLPHVRFLAQQAPENAAAQLALAQCLFNLADYAGARRVLEVGLAIDGSDPNLLLLHANLLAKEGRRDEGYAVFKKANAMNEERVAKARAAGRTVEAP
jgi:arylsulfatase A-like enzyme/thioredoxin-like negative regulator of GroEL